MGLSEDLFITSTVHQEFNCGICHEVFLNPVLTESCEHAFCKTCIESWTDDRSKEGELPTCPIDRQEITGLKALPRPFMNLYNSLQVRCKHYASGCAGTMSVGDIQDHPKQCELNPAFKKACLNGCGAMLMNKEIEGHNCISSLKIMIEELKTATTVTQLESDNLRDELGLLRSKIERLKPRRNQCNFNMMEGDPR